MKSNVVLTVFEHNSRQRIGPTDGHEDVLGALSSSGHPSDGDHNNVGHEERNAGDDDGWNRRGLQC